VKSFYLPISFWFINDPISIYLETRLQFVARDDKDSSSNRILPPGVFQPDLYNRRAPRGPRDEEGGCHVYGAWRTGELYLAATRRTSHWWSGKGRDEKSCPAGFLNMWSGYTTTTKRISEQVGMSNKRITVVWYTGLSFCSQVQYPLTFLLYRERM
jgi:hypothetical protein